MKAKKLVRVLNGVPEETPPIWLMRQAGRYLPEYKATRAKAGSFLELCYNPELAEEVTLQPLRRYDFDAAILFADILLVPQAMGAKLWFVEGEGPRLSTVESQDALGALTADDDVHEVLSPIYETVRRLSKSLPAETTLIGFAGAPWTVATYMVAGRGTPDQAPARRWAYRDPVGFGLLIDMITEATIRYLSSQIDSGAEVVKLFDSWAGSLSAFEFHKWSVSPAKRIVSELKSRYPEVPVIGFPRGAGLNGPGYAEETGIDCLAVEQNTSMADLRQQVPEKLALQGNLDPLLLRLSGSAMTETAVKICDEMRGTPFVFNLGHGITPDVDPDSVSKLIDSIRGIR
ncbi:MAG: uroporphyrinogen decarboxylase [Pseudomonadota bacterium]